MNKVANKKASKAEVIISIILCVIFVPIILINIVLIGKTYTNPEHLPSVLGISPVVCLSGSMEGKIGVNSLIFIKDYDTEALVEGDIICYLEKGKTAVTHRIEKIEYDEDGKRSFVTKGDANNTIDIGENIKPEQIEGKYIGHIEKLGGVVLFMQSPTGMILFITLPIVIYLLFDFVMSGKEQKKEKDRADELEAELTKLKAQQDEDSVPIESDKQ